MVTSWPWAARSIRAQTLSLKERDFVKVAKVTGTGKARIAISEVLPNMFSYIMLVFTILIGLTIVTETGISMVGLGQTEAITLGSMLRDNIYQGDIIGDRPALWLPPGILLTSFIVLIYIMQSSMISFFNPKLREK